MSEFRKVKLTAELIETFAGMYLSPRYDDPVATPEFHREGWAMYCSEHPQVMLIAPREHAKSTAFTFDYGLAEVCFRASDYVIIIGSTEDMAAEQLSNLREELLENEDLRRDFHIGEFEQDSKTDIIVRCTDGHRFRILARGAEQKIRGKMWKGKRPNLIICDDMEDDEQVENRDRRKKFGRWFFRAAKQALSSTGKIRVHGTVLHEDSLLANLRRNRAWKHLFYKAHKSFDDFSERLWPAGWTEERLRNRQIEFISAGDSAGYSQEFLNDPHDSDEAYLKKEDFLPMSPEDRLTQKLICAAADFAVSKADKANRTSFTIGGKDARNVISFLDQRVGRWDTLEWIDEMFNVQQTHHPDIFYVEDGVIWKAVRRTVYNEMQRRNVFINIETVPSVKDKATRGRPFQKQMRAKACRFDKDADWYEAFEHELLRFTGYSEAILDDQFDSAALLVAGLEKLGVVSEENFETEEEEEFRRADPRKSEGRSRVTGY